MVQSFLGLCHRLYNFIMKCLATYAMKRVTLGRGSHQASVQLPSPGATSAMSSSKADQVTHPMAKELPLEDASLQAEVELDPIHNHSDSGLSSTPSKEDNNEYQAAMLGIGPEAQPPKKMVSINDTVEEMIATASRKKSRKKRTEKMGSFDQDEPKPLKSILKVGSKIDEKTGFKINENLYVNCSSNLGLSS